jgi:hypothetical protein
MGRMLGSANDLDHKAVELIEAALHGGGDDNITVLLVRAGNASQESAAIAGQEGTRPPTREIPEPAHDTPARRGVFGPLLSLLLIALLGIVGVWFGFKPAQQPEKQPAPPPESPAVQAVPEPVPVSGETNVLAAPESATPSPAVSSDAAWQTEREAAAADPDLIKARHAAVLAAFARLSAWTGKPIVPPSFMIAGRPEDRPEAWIHYLTQAQEQWRTAGAAECARMRAESFCLSTTRLDSLWHWENVPGSDSTEAQFLAVKAAWAEWTGELDRMEQYLKSEPGARPFLYALPTDLFTPGRSAAVFGDRTWDGLLPLVNTVWKRRDYWLAKAGEAGTTPVEEAIRRANAIWTGYLEAGYATRPWRQIMQPDEVAAFLDALSPERFTGDVRREPEG